MLWNSAVNIVEGAVNTALDAAATNGGTNPLPLLNPNRPQVDFSSVKTDYRSEMMRRDINGKLDGEGIKAGQAIETGVTILAPIVVGAAITPKAAPQSLKTLGGLPEVEAINAVSSAGEQLRPQKNSANIFLHPILKEKIRFSEVSAMQKKILLNLRKCGKNKPPKNLQKAITRLE